MFSSLNLRTLRELSLGFGTIKASSWRCSGLLPGVSPVFDRTETILGEIFFPTRQASKAVSGSASPPRARSRVRYHQGIFLALQRSNTEGLPSIRSYRKLFWWTSFPNSPGSQSCLWERFLPESTLSGSIPSRHLLGAVAVYYRGSPQYSIVQKTILGEIFSPLARLPELSLGALPSREHALGFGTIKASSWRCSGLLPESPQYSIVQKTILGEIISPLARLPELSLGALPPREHALGFGTITASSWRCSGLLPGVSPVFGRTENYSRENRFPTRQAPRAVSGSASSPRARSRVRFHQGIFLAL